MQSQILFSIIIPTFNRADLLEKAIESILSQTFKNFEILVIDNNSTDHTDKVLEKYNHIEQVKYFKNEKNYERAYSRNRGFSLSKGKYISLLDSDDILYPTCLEDACDFVTQNPEIRFFHFLFEGVNEKYQPIYKIPYPPDNNPFKRLMKGNYISNNAVFYKKDVVDKVHFDETPVMIGIEDYDFVINVLAETKHLKRINKIGGGVLLHPNRSTNLEKWTNTYERVKYFTNKHINSIQFKAVYGKYKSLFLSNIDLYLCSFLAARGRTARAIIFMGKAIGKDVRIVFSGKFYKHILVIIKSIFRKKYID